MAWTWSAIEQAKSQCAQSVQGCRWLNTALGIGGMQGCFWTDLVRCEQDCGQPPLIAADSTAYGGFDCGLEAPHWRLSSANLIALTLNAWSVITDYEDSRRVARPAARILQVRDIWGQTLWQASAAPTHPVIGFYYDFDRLLWRAEKPRLDQKAPAQPNNVWPGLVDDEGYVRQHPFVVDLAFVDLQGQLLGQAAVLFNAMAW